MMTIPEPVVDAHASSGFISYASDDDRPFVKNMADTLMRFGLEVWWDGYEITIGDTIRGKINEGLRKCDFGVVVLSHAFFARRWPPQELAALAIGLQTGRLLPILRGITPGEVAVYDPLLADIRAESSTLGVNALAAMIVNKIRGPQTRDDRGWAVYRRQNLIVRNLPLNASMQLEKMRFEECLIQGPALLVFSDRVRFEGNHITNLAMFTVVPEGQGYVGVIGLLDIEMVGCRFKDIGMTVTQSQFDQLVGSGHPVEGSMQLPEHLA
jgi:hypothetical protein